MCVSFRSSSVSRASIQYESTQSRASIQCQNMPCTYMKDSSYDSWSREWQGSALPYSYYRVVWGVRRGGWRFWSGGRRHTERGWCVELLIYTRSIPRERHGCIDSFNMFTRCRIVLTGTYEVLGMQQRGGKYSGAQRNADRTHVIARVSPHLPVYTARTLTRTAILLYLHTHLYTS